MSTCVTVVLHFIAHKLPIECVCVSNLSCVCSSGLCACTCMCVRVHSCVKAQVDRPFHVNIVCVNEAVRFTGTVHAHVCNLGLQDSQLANPGSSYLQVHCSPQAQIP